MKCEYTMYQYLGGDDDENVWETIYCDREAIVFYTPTHPYRDEPQFTRGQNVCASCLRFMKIADDIQREVESGTLSD